MRVFPCPPCACAPHTSPPPTVLFALVRRLQTAARARRLRFRARHRRAATPSARATRPTRTHCPSPPSPSLCASTGWPALRASSGNMRAAALHRVPQCVRQLAGEAVCVCPSQQRPALGRCRAPTRPRHSLAARPCAWGLPPPQRLPAAAAAPVPGKGGGAARERLRFVGARGRAAVAAASLDHTAACLFATQASCYRCRRSSFGGLAQSRTQHRHPR